MNNLEIWLTLVLAVLGICCIANIIMLHIAMHPVKNREIELLLSGDNAECLLRSALRKARGSGVKIIAVCEDEEAEKICEILCRCNPNIVSRHASCDP